MIEPKYNFKRAVRSESRRTSPDHVISRIREMIDDGRFRAGDRLPTERELAKRLGVSRPTLRSALRLLTSAGVLRPRQGAGTFVTETNSAPSIDSGPLRVMTAFYGVTSSEISEAGRLLECAVRSLAEKRATSEDLATIGDEIVGMYASLDDPVQFAIHDKRFHQAVADAAGNRILTSLLNMVSAVLLEARSNNGIRGNDLHEAAQLSREIYQAIRKHSSVEAIDTTKLAY